MTELPVHLLLLITNICNHFLTIVCSNLSFLDMFMKDEIRGLESLYYDIKNDTLESYLTEEDIATINQEADHLHNKNKRKVGSSMAVLNLKNSSIVQRDHFRRCTVVMQRLHDGHDFKEWLEAVARKILMNEFTQIRVGFSFLSWVPITNERTYLFSAKQLAPFQYTVSSTEELLDHFSKLGSLHDSEILNHTFINTLSENPFSKSGFCPLKIVSSYIYITK